MFWRLWLEPVGPADGVTMGEQGSSGHMRKAPHWLAIVTVLATLSIVQTVSAQDEPSAHSAHIHAGTCDDIGEVEASLEDLIEPAGDRVGREEASVAAASFSIVPITLDTLLSDSFAIDVHQAGDDDAIACGEIGGVLDDRGALIIGLRPLDDSGFSGIAYLTPNASDPSETTLSTFLSDTGASAAADTDDGQPGDAAAEDLDEQTYVATVRRQVTLLVGSLQRVDALFDEPRVDDDAWISQLTAELALWQILYDESQEIAPPPEYADFNERYLEALELLDSAALDIFTALEEGDQARLDEAGAKIDEAVAILRELSSDEDVGTPAAGTPAS